MSRNGSLGGSPKGLHSGVFQGRTPVPFLFEDCTVDTDRREIRRGTGIVSAGPQVFDLLVHLIRNRDRVVSKDDLLEAVWRGRIVSDQTLTSHINAVRKAIGDSGDEQRLIRTVPRKGFRFVAEVQEASAATASAVAAPPPATPVSTEAPALPDRPSIAVLPFTNMSGDPARDYFADGMTEDIITELSRFRWLFVIARNSTFTYKDRAVDIKQVGRELGVRYVLEGGVRQAGDRVRITAQLIDATTGAHLWADRFDGPLEDVFDVQDRVTASVVGAIAPKLEQAETERAKRKPTENLNAYDYFLRGTAGHRRVTREANSEALHLLYRAIDLDRDFAAAYGMAALCYGQRYANRWMIDRSREIAEAVRLARQAVELGRDDAVALWTGGNVIDSLGDPEAGAVFIDRACTLNPNLAAAWQASGWARVHLGNPELAIAHFAQAMRLSPVDPLMWNMQFGTAAAHFFAGRIEEALSWAERAWREGQNWLPTLRLIAASNALAGRFDRAQIAAARLRELDPEFRISSLKDWTANPRPEYLGRLEEGLRKAGLPE
jgi:TolB-like protein/tetratricopeptide (TPR) repeat protein